MEELLASRVRNLNVSGIRKIFNRAASIKDSINLSIGQPDFDVPDPVKEAAIRAIRDGFNRYTMTGGITELQEGIRRQVIDRCGVEPEHLFVTSGVSGGLLLAFMSLVDEGDEVLIPDPFFIVYKVLVEQFGGVPVFYNTYPDFRIREEELESKVTDRTRIIVVNSPQNPTGGCYSEDELKTVAAVASRHRLLVLSDEIYERFTYEGAASSMLRHHPDTVMLSGFTKSMGMPGWRIGYAAGPRAVVEKMETLQQFTFVCAPSPFQKACAETLDVDLDPIIESYRKKRDLVYEGLKDRYRMVKPEGAFYFFIEVPWEGKTGTEFVEAAIKRKLLLVPGGAFSTRDTHFRLSFAASDETLERGIEALNSMAVEGK
ncbi:MAG: aminotransferase class I/II-fold pyridoxal phosphate-dependent enzyme [Chlorobi bacterium]|nr:aminotransferase class I/II-fold pyridoxal phosphate-dependent enzyme [Chlorobiota bacterium]